MDDYKNIITEITNKGCISTMQSKHLLDFGNIKSICNLLWIIEILNKLDDDIKLRLKNIFSEIIKYKDGELQIKKNIRYYLTRTDTINLTLEQKKAMHTLYNFIIDYKKNTLGVYGYAGTGKTTTVVEYVSYMIFNKYLKKVAFTAPTNKAVNVIKSKFKHHIKRIIEHLFEKQLSDNFNFDDELDYLEQNGIVIKFMTIHKLLMFQTDYSLEGETIFVRNSKKKSLISHFELVIVDECSMIGIAIIDSIFEELRKINQLSTGYNSPKLIFTGDPAQLPPVNEDESTIFCKSKKDLSYKKYKECVIYNYNNTICNGNVKINYNLLINDLLQMKNILLTNVVRSRIANVTNVCYELREWITIDKFPELEKYKDCNGVNYFEYNTNLNKVKTDWFKKFLLSIKNNEISIIVTWTNHQTNTYNDYIRRQIFGEKIQKFEANDILMLSEFYGLDAGEDIIKQKLYTSEQIKVINTKIVDVPINSFQIITNYGLRQMKQLTKIEKNIKELIDGCNKFYCSNVFFSCWVLKVYKCGDDTKNNMTIIVIDDKSKIKYEKHKTDTATAIKNFSKEMVSKYKLSEVEKFIIKPLWKQWHKIFVEPFACVNYGYSTTCHKGQGSSFYDVYVDLHDILQNYKRITETKKCAYTAATRAINELNLLI